MKKLSAFACTLLAFQFCANAQFTRYIIQLTDKKGATYSLSNPAAFLSQRSIERRTRQNIDIDSTDLPVSKTYLDNIRAVPSVTIHNVSKWLNQVCIQTNSPSAITTINSFPFVKKIQGITPRVRQPASQAGPGGKLLPSSGSHIQGITALDYGEMYDQVHVHDGDYLHNLGFTGDGMQIAVLDAGFQEYKNNPVFDSLRLLGEWDYVQNNANVNDDNSHGAYVLSIIASNRPGVLVGSAPHASYWLFRTEDVGSEYPVEEQNWAVAAEFADSAGVDMISSSLGYDLFDNAAFDHSYAQRNGNTAMITIAADLAAQKGILVVCSAGNTGGSTDDRKYVGCPADGDSVFTVGGIDVNGNIYGGSSWGPNGAGRLKPNAVSVGVNTVIANFSGEPATGVGTSYACPNLAGLMACLWQAYPEFTNMEIFDAVQKSANRYNNPDNRFGYGIPNFRIAYDQLSILRDIRRKDSILTTNFIKAYPVPVGNNGFRVIFKAPGSGKATLRLINELGQVLNTRVMEVMSGQTYFVDYSSMTSHGVFYIRYDDGANKHTLPIIR